jgi:TonB family protein
MLPAQTGAQEQPAGAPPPSNPTPKQAISALPALDWRQCSGAALYTQEARELGIQGDVVLRVELDDRGQVGDVTVVAGLGNGLDEVAVRAIHSDACRFTPASSLQGLPVPYVIPRYTFHFTLPPAPTASMPVHVTSNTTSGPALVAQGQDDEMPKLPPKKAMPISPKRRGQILFGVGLGLFAVGYLSQVALFAQANAPPGYFAPVVPPFLAASDAFRQTGQCTGDSFLCSLGDFFLGVGGVLFTFDGIVQIGGLATAGAGLTIMSGSK